METTTAAELHRLADRARAERLRLQRAPGSATQFRAESRSRPGHWHYLELGAGASHGCDCEGYERWRRCRHYAAALAANNWLPDPEPPAAASPAPRITAAEARERAIAHLAGATGREIGATVAALNAALRERGLPALSLADKAAATRRRNRAAASAGAA